MALIKCPECGRDISTWAPACPGCGVPQIIIQTLLLRKEGVSSPIDDNSPDQEILQTKDTTKNILVRRLFRHNQTIKCVICKNTYDSFENDDCPKCRYPYLSIGMDGNKAKNVIGSYRREKGINWINLKPGQYHKMGVFGGETINWRVLSVEAGKALLISEKGLDARRFHEKRENVIWNDCSLRVWLNTEFLNSAFTEMEKLAILETKIESDENRRHQSDVALAANSKMFLLSIQEAEQYFVSDEDRKATPSTYARNKGINEKGVSDSCCWWLRSSGFFRNDAALVNDCGKINRNGNYVFSESICVRPAMWVKLQ